ncbi:MAG: hypothetical protein U0904_09920 [Candidatus Nanopelagicales bacterium]|nr:hypothetical protein [Candidatus Nanopelagicales bacterium]
MAATMAVAAAAARTVALALAVAAAEARTVPTVATVAGALAVPVWDSSVTIRS